MSDTERPESVEYVLKDFRRILEETIQFIDKVESGNLNLPDPNLRVAIRSRMGILRETMWGLSDAHLNLKR